MSSAEHRFSWQHVLDIVSRLSARVRLDGAPDLLVCVQRGGLIPGVLLSHQLRTREILCLDIARTTSEGIDADKTSPQLRNGPNLFVIEDRNVLLVDDIAGTGETIRYAQRLLKDHNVRRLRTLVTAVNRANWQAATQLPPDRVIEYIGEEVYGWVTFPWEPARAHGNP
jgi:hypoxanthine phosphoribosyltransferase